MNGENWRDIPGFEEIYQVSDLGRVRSLDRVVHQSDGKTRFQRGRIFKPGPTPKGYLTCVLSINAIKRTYAVHLLMAYAFLNHKPQGHTMVVDHINNIPSDNRLENLQIVTNRYNSSKDRKGTSKYTGVRWVTSRKKWRSDIKTNEKSIFLGYFADELEASVAYQNALAKLQENETIHRNSTRRCKDYC